MCDTSKVLDDALKIVQEAITLDTEKKYLEALTKYRMAIERFIHVIRYENNPKRKEVLEAKAAEYMGRAEALKKMIEIPERPVPVVPELPPLPPPQYPVYPQGGRPIVEPPPPPAGLNADSFSQAVGVSFCVYYCMLWALPFLPAQITNVHARLVASRLSHAYLAHDIEDKYLTPSTTTSTTRLTVVGSISRLFLYLWSMYAAGHWVLTSFVFTSAESILQVDAVLLTLVVVAMVVVPLLVLVGNPEEAPESPFQFLGDSIPAFVPSFPPVRGLNMDLTPLVPTMSIVWTLFDRFKGGTAGAVPLGQLLTGRIIVTAILTQYVHWMIPAVVSRYRSMPDWSVLNRFAASCFVVCAAAIPVSATVLSDGGYGEVSSAVFAVAVQFFDNPINLVLYGVCVFCCLGMAVRITHLQGHGAYDTLSSGIWILWSLLPNHLWNLLPTQPWTDKVSLTAEASWLLSPVSCPVTLLIFFPLLLHSTDSLAATACATVWWVPRAFLFCGAFCGALVLLAYVAGLVLILSHELVQSIWTIFA